MPHQNIDSPPLSATQWANTVMSGLSPSQEQDLKLFLEESNQSLKNVFVHQLARTAGVFLGQIMGDEKDKGSHSSRAIDHQSSADRKSMKSVMHLVIPALLILPEPHFSECIYALRISIAGCVGRFQEKTPRHNFCPDLSSHAKSLLAHRITAPSVTREQLDQAVRALSVTTQSAAMCEAWENWQAHESKNGLEQEIAKMVDQPTPNLKKTRKI